MVKAKRSTYLTGWTTKQLLSVEPEDFFDMDSTGQVEAVSRLSSAANKRLKRIEAAGLAEYSPAYKDVMQQGKFSVKGKNEKELYQEFKRLNRFFRRSTATAKGARQFKKEVQNIFKDVKDVEAPAADAEAPASDTDKARSNEEHIYTSSDLFIKLMNRSREIFPDGATLTLYYQTIKDKASSICERHAAWTWDDVQEALAEFDIFLEKLYRAEQEEKDSYKKYAEKAAKLLGY